MSAFFQRPEDKKKYHDLFSFDSQRRDAGRCRRRDEGVSRDGDGKGFRAKLVREPEKKDLLELGYVFLQHIEKVSGKNYETFMREENSKQRIEKMDNSGGWKK